MQTFERESDQKKSEENWDVHVSMSIFFSLK